MSIRFQRPWADLRASIALLLCSLAAAAVPAAAAEFTVATPPAWVRPVSVDKQADVPNGQLSQGVYYLLSDTQMRIEAGDRVAYRHVALQAVTQSGLETAAHVQIGFDPAYQTLTLHSIRVHRDGRIMQRLKAASVRILQQEKELEYRIFDGSKTAHVFLEDVRVGDVVEFDYSVRGANPVFANRHFGRTDLQWSVPVRQVAFRLLWPTGRDLRFTSQGAMPPPDIIEHDGTTEQRWQARDVPALLVDDDAPAWFDPYPAVRWTEYADWTAVARWAVPLYRVPSPLGPALQAEVRRIAGMSADPQARVLETLRFVQREIRYLGVEIGAGSHAPSAPDTVLQRRFGDCKDKSLLTVTLLSALGIEARPALVHTTLRGHIADLPPTPGAFNHVVVRVRLQGRDLWLDPTRSPQPGGLDTLVQPPYEQALVVDTATTGLSPMAEVPRVRREVRTLIDSSDGLDKPARFMVSTSTEGAHAESLRDTLAAENREDLQKRYLNYYSRYYHDVSVDRPMAVADDGQANRVALAEQYSVRDFWSRDEGKKRLVASVFAPDMEEALRTPRQPKRSAPLSLGPPTEFVYTTEVRLPEDWPVTPDKVVVKDPAFDYEHRIEVDGPRRVRLTERLVWHVPHIEAADTARYVANLERARSSLGYEFYKTDAAAAPTPTGGQFNWLVASVALMMTAGWLWLARRVWLLDPAPAPGLAFSRPAGIAGWLWLPALAVVMLPLRLLFDLVKLAPTLSVDHWSALTMPGSAQFDPMWAPVLLYEVAINLGMLTAYLLLAHLFFTKRSSTPRIFIATLVFAWLVRAGDLLLVGTLADSAHHGNDQDVRNLVTQGFWAVVWTLYFLRSERVAGTFTARLRHPPAAAATSGTHPSPS